MQPMVSVKITIKIITKLQELEFHRIISMFHHCVNCHCEPLYVHGLF